MTVWLAVMLGSTVTAYCEPKASDDAAEWARQVIEATQRKEAEERKKWEEDSKKRQAEIKKLDEAVKEEKRRWWRNSVLIVVAILIPVRWLYRKLNYDDDNDKEEA